MQDIGLTQDVINGYLKYFNKDHVYDYMIIDIMESEYQAHLMIQDFTELDKLPKQIEGIYYEHFEWIAMRHKDFIEYITFKRCDVTLKEYNAFLRQISRILDIHYHKAKFYSQGARDNIKELFINREILKAESIYICDKLYELIKKFN